MSLLRILNNGKGGKYLLNLTKVSTIDLTNNTISFTLAHDRNNIMGSLIWITGGENRTLNYVYNSAEEAQKEFDNIIKDLNNYYKK